MAAFTSRTSAAARPAPTAKQSPGICGRKVSASPSLPMWSSSTPAASRLKPTAPRAPSSAAPTASIPPPKSSSPAATPSALPKNWRAARRRRRGRQQPQSPRPGDHLRPRASIGPNPLRPHSSPCIAPLREQPAFGTHLGRRSLRPLLSRRSTALPGAQTRPISKSRKAAAIAAPSASFPRPAVPPKVCPTKR